MLHFHFDFVNSSSPTEGKAIGLPFLLKLTDFEHASFPPKYKAIGLPFLRK